MGEESASEMPVIVLDGPALFLKEDARALLKGKRIYFVGDSNMRAWYKDLLVLLQDGKVSHPQHFKVKMEAQFKDDQIVDHAEFSKGRDYKEVRVFEKDDFFITFAFVTKCWPNYYLQELFSQIRAKTIPHPDLILMCSMLWDISRYGPAGVSGFKRCMPLLAAEVKRTLNPGTFVWLTNPPVGANVSGAFLTKELDFMSSMMRFHVMEANAFSCDVMKEADLEAFDLHYYMCYVTDLRDVDATHWRPEGVRLIVCLILTHICCMWGVTPPRFRKPEMDIMKDINYDQLVRSLLYLKEEKGWPQWVTKMIENEPTLLSHLESFVPR